MTPAPMPWHAPVWERVHAMLDGGRVHHALLLSGPAGLGKSLFAARAAAALLCEVTAPARERPCGECRSCLLYAAGSHPDLLHLQPEEDRRSISVEQVRGRLADLSLTAHYAGHRVALIQPADALNRHAADALLKTLEEPGGAVVFLLVTDRESLLPVTLRSRCLALRFPPARSEEAIAWMEEEGAIMDAAQRDAALDLLAWCGGAPLAARDALGTGLSDAVASMGEDLDALMTGSLGTVAAAARWRSLGLASVLQWQLRIVTALMRRTAGGGDGGAALATLPIECGLDLKRLNFLCDELLELRSAEARALNPNEQLGLEHLAASWAAAGRGTSSARGRR